MIEALFACFAARFWIGAAQSVRQEHRWSLDIPVTGMALAVSAAIVIAMRPEPLGGLLYRAGLGVLDEGILKIAGSICRRLAPCSVSKRLINLRSNDPTHGGVGAGRPAWKNAPARAEPSDADIGPSQTE
jgi:hypothetical protein